MTKARTEFRLVELPPVAAGDPEDEFGRLNPVERYLHICEILATINERMNHHQEMERQGLDTPRPNNGTMPPEEGGAA
jgi:hypothetical protein